MSDLTVSDAAVLNLNISGIILSALCGLFGTHAVSVSSFRLDVLIPDTLCSLGVYFVLFLLGLWSTFRHRTRASRRLRTITIVLYAVIKLNAQL